MRHNDIIINRNVSLLEAMKVMDNTAKKILYVTDDDRLVGVVTDGDIRRWILKSNRLDTGIENVMNTHPVYVAVGNEADALHILEKNEINSVAVVDFNKKIVNIMFAYANREILCKKLLTPVVIMAGGEGKRLYPYTKVLPKPLIPIGDLTIVERILNNFEKYGCEHFYMSVNYKKNMIKAYFTDLNRYDITYIEENIPLGTCGSLYYAKGNLSETFFVSNCDILVNADYNEMYHYHKENKNQITVISSIKNTVIPYGTIELQHDGSVKGITEKPQLKHLINTGMYILEPEVLQDIPKDMFYHMTDLIKIYVESGKKVGVFPVSEKSWIDMGQIKEMEHMIREIENLD